MSVTLVGPEGFFNRQGAFIGEVNRVADGFYGSALDAGFLSIWLQFASADQAAVQNLPDVVETFRQTANSYLGIIVGDGSNAAILQVNRDEPLVPQSLAEAFTRIRDQMIDQGQTINRPTVGSSVTPGGSNLSDVTVVVSTTNKYGDPSDMIFAETVTATVTAATGGESFAGTITFVGEPLRDGTDYRWPGGSGTSASFGITDGGSTTLVTDGAFAEWTGTGSDFPVNWDIIDGDAGVTVFDAPGTGLRDGYNAANLVSDGSQPTQLAQNVSLSTNTVYAVAIYVKKNEANTDGSFVVQFTDGDGNLLQNDAGDSLSFVQTISSYSNSDYTIVTAFFATPRQLPVNVQVRYGFFTAPTSTRGIKISTASVVAATPLYNQGPYAAAFSGIDRPALADTWSVVFTNSLGSQSFVRGFDRLYSLRNMVNNAGDQVYLPSAVSETISDSLVTH